MTHLLSLLDDGFWMTVPSEHLLGLQTVNLVYRAHMTCFTELRLSGSANHAGKYGLLGVVVNRSFVLERGGGPVHYVRSHQNDPLVSNIQQHFAWLVRQVKSNVADADIIMMHNLHLLVGYTKAMSNPDTDDFAYLDENEWRIVHSDIQEMQGKIINTGQTRPHYRVPFSRGDVQMLIVADKELRSSIQSNSRFISWSEGQSPPILTIDEIGHF